MAVPKKKMSRSRTRRRKAGWKLSATQTVACSRCNAQKLPHHACPECGTYRGREALPVE